MARVVLAMSGGVDSSVAAGLLLEQGHEVVGLFMRHGKTLAEPTACAVENTPSQPGSGTKPVSLPVISTTSGHKRGCCTASDAQDARRVADRLEVPFYALNFEKDFDRIIHYFVDEYSRGRTPNPCVMCNNWVKFGSLVEYADSVGAEFIATGHYAQLAAGDADEMPALCRGLDKDKDQSYVLFGIQRELLPRLMFPVGAFQKSEIRERARSLGLRVADKRDSQEICFIPDGDYARFVRFARSNEASQEGEAPDDLAGEIVTTAGEVVGHHRGIEQYTIGQRKGLGVAFGEPRYVVRLDVAERRVVIGKREDLATEQLTARGANWLVAPPDEPWRCTVQIRYQSGAAMATVHAEGKDRFAVTFDQPQFGVAPGQAAVCYDGARVLGGGWIE